MTMRRAARKDSRTPVGLTASYADTLCTQIKALKLPMPVFEHRFHKTRRWRFDMAWIYASLAMEIEGGVWTGGRHVNPSGFLADLEKYNTATLMGWRVLRVTPAQVANGHAVALVEKALGL